MASKDAFAGFGSSIGVPANGQFAVEASLPILGPLNFGCRAPPRSVIAADPLGILVWQAVARRPTPLAPNSTYQIGISSDVRRKALSDLSWGLLFACSLLGHKSFADIPRTVVPLLDVLRMGAMPS